MMKNVGMEIEDRLLNQITSDEHSAVCRAFFTVYPLPPSNLDVRATHECKEGT